MAPQTTRRRVTRIVILAAVVGVYFAIASRWPRPTLRA
jgi:hypothetical protein